MAAGTYFLELLLAGGLLNELFNNPGMTFIALRAVFCRANIFDTTCGQTDSLLCLPVYRSNRTDGLKSTSQVDLSHTQWTTYVIFKVSFPPSTMRPKIHRYAIFGHPCILLEACFKGVFFVKSIFLHKYVQLYRPLRIASYSSGITICQHVTIFV